VNVDESPAAVDDIPAAIEDQPALVDEVGPFDEPISTTHDAASVPLLTTESRLPPLEEWLPITPSTTAELVVTIIANDSASVVNTAASRSFSESSLTNAANTRQYQPVVPPQSRTALPATPASSSGAAAAGWLPVVTSLNLQDGWSSVHHPGRKLPSVIVLPNLAPPG